MSFSNGKPADREDVSQSIGREYPISKGVYCLSLLARMPEFEDLVRRWVSPVALSMIAPWILICEASLKDFFYKPWLRCKQNDHERFVLDCSARIWQNTRRPLQTRGDCTFDQYADLITGENLRWEAVGMYITAVGLAAITLDSHDSSVGRRHLARQTGEMSDICLTFCEMTGHLTDAELWLCLENSHLCSIVEGDSSDRLWRRLGNLASLCVAKGLHNEIRVSPEVPFWLSELRKRTFAVAYILDKTISSFHGRPPRLLRKYSVMQLPLDLDPKHMQLPREQLEAEIETLDGNGWNTMRVFRGTVYVRTMLICCMLGEDVLEYALSTLPSHNALRAQEISQRLKDAWKSLPSFIRDVGEGRSDSPDPYLPDLIALDFVFADFQLHKAMVRRGHATRDEMLVDLSRDVLSRVLRMLPKNAIGLYNCDMSFIIVKYGLPAAGVLGIELLHRAHSPRRAPWPHRSEVIQNLSIFISALNSKVPGHDGNYEMCAQAHRGLQNILDLILRPPNWHHSNSMLENDTTNSDRTDEADRWLEQAQSAPQFWASLSGHPLLANSLSRQNVLD